MCSLHIRKGFFYIIINSVREGGEGRGRGGDGEGRGKDGEERGEEGRGW